VDAFSDKYGPWAIVTGAAQGLGAAFARDLLARRVSVLGVDRSPVTDPDVTAVTADLSTTAGVDTIVDAAKDLDVGLVINNAAISYEGPFLDQGVDSALAQLDINCRAPLLLAHAFLPRLVARGRGGMIFISSMSAWRGAPLVTGYAATKAWGHILGESLWEEMKPFGVDVMAVLPGSMPTPGFVASMPQPSMGTANMMDPADAVHEALDALGSAPSMTPGQANRDSEAFMAALDRTEAVTLMGQVMRQMYPPQRTPDPAR